MESIGECPKQYNFLEVSVLTIKLELQGRYTTQAYYKSGFVSPECHAKALLTSDYGDTPTSLFKPCAHI